MKLFALINKICNAHSSNIITNLQTENKYGQEYTSEDFESTERIITKHWKKICSDKISLEKFLQEIKKVSTAKCELWKSHGETLWVTSFTVNNEDTFLPNIYDLLRAIFDHSETIDRQKYFHELTRSYYNGLKENLQKNGIILENILSQLDFEEKVDQFLPCVKFDIFKDLLENYNQVNVQKVKDFVEELVEFIICPDVLREDCYKIIKKLHCTDCESFTFELKPIRQQFGNFGQYYHLNLLLKCSDKLKQFQFFAKTPPADNDVLRELVMLSVEKEEFIYSTYISKLQELGFGDVADFAPEPFFIRKNKIMVLEDLGKEGYKSTGTTNESDFEIIVLALKSLAKVHASSLLLEEHMSRISGKPYRLDEVYGEYLQETLIFKENPYYKFSPKYTCEYFSSKFQEVLNGINLEEFQKKVGAIFESLYSKVLKSSKYRNVLNHGDPWSGNVLYKLVPDQMSCRLVDYQLLRYTPPIVDVLMLLYINTNKQFRDIHMKKLLSLYRETLEDILKRFDVDANDIYDESTFNKCFEEFKPVGIMLGIHYSSILALPAEINPMNTGNNEQRMEFVMGDRTDVYEEAFKCNIFTNKIKGYFEEFYDYLK